MSSMDVRTRRCLQNRGIRHQEEVFLADDPIHLGERRLPIADQIEGALGHRPHAIAPCLRDQVEV